MNCVEDHISIKFGMNCVEDQISIEFGMNCVEAAQNFKVLGLSRITIVKVTHQLLHDENQDTRSETMERPAKIDLDYDTYCEFLSHLQRIFLEHTHNDDGEMNLTFMLQDQRTRVYYGTSTDIVMERERSNPILSNLVGSDLYGDLGIVLSEDELEQIELTTGVRVPAFVALCGVDQTNASQPWYGDYTHSTHWMTVRQSFFADFVEELELRMNINRRCIAPDVRRFYVNSV